MTPINAAIASRITADYLKLEEAPTLAYDYRDRDDREDAS